MKPPDKKGSHSPTFEQAVEIWRLLKLGWFQHHIAARFGFNQGRISEVKTGKRHPDARHGALGGM